MSTRFNDLAWHDATLLEVRINRRRAGEADEVTMPILWPDGRRSTIRFIGCYSLVATMNFGVVAEENVRSASESDDSDELRRHQAMWARLGVDLSGLRMFHVETNSTASTITVFARGWREEDEQG